MVVVCVSRVDRGALGLALAVALAGGGEEARVAAGGGDRRWAGADDVVGVAAGGETRGHGDGRGRDRAGERTGR